MLGPHPRPMLDLTAHCLAAGAPADAEPFRQRASRWASLPRYREVADRLHEWPDAFLVTGAGWSVGAGEPAWP